MTLLILLAGAGADAPVVEIKGDVSISDMSPYTASASDQSIYASGVSDQSIYAVSVGDT
jgi:hypothetical protein